MINIYSQFEYYILCRHTFLPQRYHASNYYNKQNTPRPQTCNNFDTNGEEVHISYMKETWIGDFKKKRPSKIHSQLSVTCAHWIKWCTFLLFTTKSPHLCILIARYPYFSHTRPPFLLAVFRSKVKPRVAIKIPKMRLKVAMKFLSIFWNRGSRLLSCLIILG